MDEPKVLKKEKIIESPEPAPKTAMAPNLARKVEVLEGDMSIMKDQVAMLLKRVAAAAKGLGE